MRHHLSVQTEWGRPVRFRLASLLIFPAFCRFRTFGTLVISALLSMRLGAGPSFGLALTQIDMRWYRLSLSSHITMFRILLSFSRIQSSIRMIYSKLTFLVPNSPTFTFHLPLPLVDFIHCLHGSVEFSYRTGDYYFWRKSAISLKLISVPGGLAHDRIQHTLGKRSISILEISYQYLELHIFKNFVYSTCMLLFICRLFCLYVFVGLESIAGRLYNYMILCLCWEC